MTKKRFERKGKSEAKRSLQDAHSLQFNVAQLLKQSGSDTRQYDILDATLPKLNNEFRLAAAINGKVKLIKTDKEIFVSGFLNTEVVLPCTRCVKDVNIPVELEIEETFSPTIDVSTGTQIQQNEDADEATLINEQHILDLGEVIRQTLHLNQPVQVLCQETCQGLCQQCGIDLNVENCDCSDDEIDERWAGLLNIKQNFK
ncbi:MAG: DUF177 domain-containing protein [Chloroflexota bacterium]